MPELQRLRADHAAAVRTLCDLAVEEHRLRRIVAAASLDNLASQKVLANAGFVPVGPAEPAEVGGKPGLRYERVLDRSRRHPNGRS